MNNPKMEIFAARLKEVRVSNHMTQKEFARQIGVTPAALSAYENNQKNPSVAVIQRIGENFNVSLSWLCGITERKSVNKVFSTYADIIDTFFDIMNIGKLDVYPESKEVKDFQEQPSEMWGIMFSDPTLIKFIKEWNHMRNLTITGAIDQDLYQIWIDREIKKYNFPIVSQHSSSAASDLLAAHARTDVEQTPEGVQHDLDIMNDDKNWK